jgi:O-antigen/teichoic acid export membrane protein
MYIIVIGKIFAASVAGHYFFAKKIRDLVVNQLVKSVKTVTFPALATLQEEQESLKAGYQKIIKVTTFLLFPGMIFIAALAEPFFTVFLNDKWMPAIPYLQLMCIAGIMSPLHSINVNILQVKGRSDLMLHIEIIKKIISISILAITIHYGVIGILWGQIVSSIISYLPNSHYSSKLIEYSINEQIYDILPNLMLAGSIGIIVYFGTLITNLSALSELVIFSFLAGTLYLSLSYGIKLEAFIITKKYLADMGKKENVDG